MPGGHLRKEYSQLQNKGREEMMRTQNRDMNSEAGDFRIEIRNPL